VRADDERVEWPRAPPRIVRVDSFGGGAIITVDMTSGMSVTRGLVNALVWFCL